MNTGWWWNTDTASATTPSTTSADSNIPTRITWQTLFRPPHGHMGFRQYYTLRYHYRIIMWDLVTRDYSKRMRPEQVLNNVKRYARNGSIITFHDSLKSWNNGNLQYALPRSIEFLKEEGYEFKVL